MIHIMPFLKGRGRVTIMAVRYAWEPLERVETVCPRCLSTLTDMLNQVI